MINNRATRQYADDFPALADDILKALVFLAPGEERECYSPAGGIITLICCNTGKDFPTFRYLLDNGEDGILHTTATRAGFGGIRWWYVCPHCQTRCGRLYWSRTKAGCRQCMNLHYRCQSENTADRELRRIRRGRHAIWGRDTPDINFLMQGLSTYRRPKGMHRRHYERRVRKQYDAEQVFLRALLVVLRRRYKGGKISRSQEGHKIEREKRVWQTGIRSAYAPLTPVRYQTNSTVMTK